MTSTDNETKKGGTIADYVKNSKGSSDPGNSQGSKMETPELSGLEITKDSRNEKLKPKDLQNQAIKEIKMFTEFKDKKSGAQLTTRSYKGLQG